MGIHHGKKDSAYPEFDPRRNWDKGEVIKIEHAEFVVELVNGRQTNVPLPKRGMSSADLMILAKRNLRCIDWEQIVAHKDLLFFSNAANTQANASLNVLTGGNLFSYSRPVWEGEQVDFFVSHSWHDD